ncbi:putative F-box protein At1g50870 [Lycium barbarum]|uniref:putative F-box protein At1g50870 n=1 Tax=Lycium barbarum TaxID=112863 RepID=UPI00293F3B79|nr:putative F-box protein At1g50870 [Lycium barbarum]
MEGTLNEFAITATKKWPPSPFQDKGATECIQCQRTEEKHGFVDDIVFEILTRLLAKSLMRFKCVSKAWNSLIRQDSNFFKWHNARSQARPSATRLLFEIVIDYRAVVESTSNFSTQLEGLSLQLMDPHHYFGSREIFICSNHCNGLVCLYSYLDTQVYLYNTTTREIKALPFSLSNPKGLSPRLFLGFDLNTEKYKLLHVNKQHKIEILTLGTNSWIRIDEKCQNYSRICYSDYCIFLNGMLYWIDDIPDTITYFNFIEEKFGTISLPQWNCFHILNKMQIALSGKLVIYQLGINQECYFVYHEVNKFFVESYIPDLENKVVLLEAENIDKITHYPK